MIRWLFLILALTASPAFANHPGEDLDEVMADKEPYFEVTNTGKVPEIELFNQNQGRFNLSDLDDQILILSGYTDLMVDGAPSPHQSDTTLRWLIDRLRS
ncbi:hypothetical protein [Thalassospira lohafexi]|uniref:hypothetical protein n=1 Tax=Thalassospira lohafexi TaxID=744227 RepID=UPI00197DC216|nr:hypothetical protein [Thalassospira lohafexi]